MRRIAEPFRDFFRRLWLVIFDAKTQWEFLQTDTADPRKVFLSPAVAICIASSLLGALLAGKSAAVCLVKPLVTLTALSGAVAFTLKISRIAFFKFFKKPIPKEMNLKLVGYSFAAVFVFRMIAGLMPGLIFIRLINVYTLYLVSVAAQRLMPKPDTERDYYTLIVFLTIVFSPFLIEKIFIFLLPNLPL